MPPTSTGTPYKTDRDFNCGVCFDDYLKGAPLVLAAGDPVCKACYLASIKPLFVAAVKSENDYPVPWGENVLHPKDFPDLDEKFMAEWLNKMEEYDMPRTDRIYCTAAAHRFYIDPDGGKVFFTGPDDIARAEQRGCFLDDDRPFIGSLAGTRGRNICGKLVHHDGEHWTNSSCPRWNQPGTARAHNDQAGAPLVIEDVYVDAARDLRAEAADAPNEQFRQMLLDQATCSDMLGNAMARLTRAQQNGGHGLPGIVFGEWVRPLEILVGFIESEQDPYFYSLGGEPSMYSGDMIDLGKTMFATRVWRLDGMVAEFRAAHLAVFEMYPELGPLIERARAVFVREIGSIEGIMEASATEALDNLVLHLATGDADAESDQAA
ncbi:hypothetical protein LTR36_002484 [Oleoguttula mirabilis]|uniref:Uncharacterized protein n=1 Tax=Oleoguttula mirabilis TaxID=1507867 RepID=A0AAV9JKY1_9PEZI|nr:hypothetical protein LTR36_002484 [Oleoguttula mirabilis]